MTKLKNRSFKKSRRSLQAEAGSAKFFEPILVKKAKKESLSDAYRAPDACVLREEVSETLCPL
jgi:hypothetical protein